MESNIMVCVTQQKNCERLIHEGKVLIDHSDENSKLYVIHVVNEKDKFLYQLDDSEALEYLFEVSKEVDAELIVKRNNEVLKVLTKTAKELGITDIVMGSAKNKVQTSRFEEKLRMKLKNLNFHVL
ncbi:MAG: universal stress protein UspA [Tissierellales bacterium]|jgi:K+-sensing histidine kinase KdpD|nr:universal stress protein UspA [Tissierellales bacterium]